MYNSNLIKNKNNTLIVFGKYDKNIIIHERQIRHFDNSICIS